MTIFFIEKRRLEIRINTYRIEQVSCKRTGALFEIVKD